MDLLGIVQRYSQLKKIPVNESYDNESHVYSVTVGDMHVSVIAETKQLAKADAFRKLLELNADILRVGASAKQSWKERFAAMPGIDYLAYSRDTVLRDCRIRYNDPSFFDMDLKVVSFDSEGRPLRLAQFCSGKDVYLFDLPTYYHEVRRVLEDPDVKKILCDARSEEASFGIVIHNYTDIQAGSPERKSLAKLVEAHTGVTVKKNRLIHMHGWKHERRLTKDQLDYAAADVLWTLAVYANHQNAA